MRSIAHPILRCESGTQVLEAMGDDHLEQIRIGGPEGEQEVRAESLFVFIGAAPRTEWLPAAILRDEKGFLLAGPDLRLDGKIAPEWKENREPYLLEIERSGRVCGRGRAPWIGEAGGVRGGRRIDRGAVCAPVSGGVLRWRSKHVRDERRSIGSELRFRYSATGRARGER